MTSQLGRARQNLKRSIMHCGLIQSQVAWIYDTYEESHPDFAERLFVAATTAKGLADYLAGLQQQLREM